MPRIQPGGRTRLSYANVTASLALFIALGGTAAAAVTLDRDSVGSQQIRTDAVRSPELAKDAVRSPEISSGAVRSSEIRDGGIKSVDISTGARTKLLGALKLAEDDNDGSLAVPRCDGSDLSVCPNQVELPLSSAAGSSQQADPAPAVPGGPTPGPVAPEAGRNWVIQAELHVAIGHTRVEALPRPGVANCGLVNSAATGPKAVLDEVQVGDPGRESSEEDIELSAILTKRAKNPTVALRCTSQGGDRVTPTLVKISAQEVGSITAP